MAVVRNVTSPGVFAEEAETVIPPDPIVGVAYRDVLLTEEETTAGWYFRTAVAGDKFNEMLYRYTTLLTELDKFGILGWTDQLDYNASESIVRGSDGNIYKCLIDNGISGTPVDPVDDDGTYWKNFVTDVPESIDIIDNLNSNRQDAALSANMGNFLDLIKADGAGNPNQTFNVGTPTADTHATRKEYVDDAIGSVDVGVTTILAGEGIDIDSPTGDVRISGEAASTSNSGIVQLNDTLTSTSTTEALTANQGSVIKVGLDGKEPLLDADRKRKITVSEGYPVDGEDGDIWMKYEE